LTPFFGPGILYNSIKSGMAVDYPIYTEYPTTTEDILAGAPSSSIAGGIGNDDTAKWSRVLNKEFTRRIPFEGLLEPENYVARAPIWDAEPEWSASLRIVENLPGTNQSSLWGGQGSEKYKLAMHNFLAETVDFFLEDGNFTTFVSKEIPSDGIIITPQEATSFYGMDIYVSNSQCRSLTEWNSRKNLSYLTSSLAIPQESLNRIKGIHTQMYSRDSAFGPPWVLENNLFKKGVLQTDTTRTVPAYHYSYEPFTPAYFNGFGIIRLLFYPFKGPGKYTLKEIQSNFTV
jgi:hypothetical protein